jgi:uncharacterized membrane protein YkoI
MGRLILPVGLVLALAAGGAVGGDDHDRARRLREAGDVLPLEQVLQSLRQRSGAAVRVLEVELERKHGRWIYEIEYLNDQGRVREARFDARSGEPLSDRPED